MSNVTQPVPRSTPYVAAGAPTSPVILMIAGWLVAGAVWLAGRYGVELPVGDATTTMVASALVGIIGAAQSWLARREQTAGVPLLEQAFAEPPPPADARLDVSESVERLRRRSEEVTVPLGAPTAEPFGLAGDPPATLTWLVAGLPKQAKHFPKLSAARAYARDRGLVDFTLNVDAADQLHALDPSAQPGLDKWSGLALREIRGGAKQGRIGPISWDRQGKIFPVAIDGWARPATLDDVPELARALGATKWLEADENAAHCTAPNCNATVVFEQWRDGTPPQRWCADHVPALEPGESRRRLGESSVLRRMTAAEAAEPSERVIADDDALQPRKHPPSNALLDELGNPISASDLESSDDERLDTQQAERVEAEVTARSGWDPGFAATFWRSKHAGLKAEIAVANEDGVGSWLTFGMARRKTAERLLEEIVGAREAHGIYARIWKDLTGKDLGEADPDERTTDRRPNDEDVP